MKMEKSCGVFARLTTLGCKYDGNYMKRIMKEGVLCSKNSFLSDELAVFFH